MGTLVVRGPVYRSAHRPASCASAQGFRWPAVPRRVGEPGVVVSVAMLGAGSDPAGYYLARQANCPADYYLGAEPMGRWLGSGAAAAGLTGRLDASSATTLRALLEGTTPDGRQLVAPVLRADPRGRLPAGPLVDAIQARADHDGRAGRVAVRRPDRPGPLRRPRDPGGTAGQARPGSHRGPAEGRPAGSRRRSRRGRGLRRRPLCRGSEVRGAPGGPPPARNRRHRLRTQVGQRAVRTRRPGHRAAGPGRPPGRRHRGGRLPRERRGARAARPPGRRPPRAADRHGRLDRRRLSSTAPPGPTTRSCTPTWWCRTCCTAPTASGPRSTRRRSTGTP